MAVAAAAATMSATAVSRRCVVAAGTGGGKDGKFLRYFRRTTMRAFRPFPVAGADEDFAVALTLFTMKFVNRHEGKIIGSAEISSVGSGRRESAQIFLSERTHARRCANQGDNFSRCGRWSRFQPTKAASLVSSNRNFSVGDSTWPSQKTTLARL